jgi:hypothetical protein
MQRDDVRKTVTAQFYQSLSESGVEITAIPQSQLQTLVNALADGVFAALAAVDAESDTLVNSNLTVSRSASAIPVSEPQALGDVEETLLWRGRPYLTIGTVYELTTQRLRIIRGILGNQVEEIELIRVRDTRVKQHLGERALNVGDVTILSNDTTAPEIVLNNVSDPLAVRELIRKAVQAEKERRGLRYREDVD